MPIYAYKCSACGHEQDVLQKMSDPLLSVCPECNQDTYVKQVTAAGFQLKGSGWYVTDFRNKGASGKPADTTASPEGGSGASASKPAASETPAAPSSGGASGAASA